MTDHRALNLRLLKLAIPNILTNITIPLLGIVDLGLSGHLSDPAVVGGVAIATTLFNLLYWNFSFLRMGSTGLTAQARGTGDKKAIGRTLGQSLLLSVAFGTLILLLQSPIKTFLLGLLHPDPALSDYAGAYYDIVIWSAPAMLFIYALNGWIIGLENTWWPMVVSITTNVVNIALSSYLVLARGMGIEGIATGTLVAQWLGAGGLFFGAWRFYLQGRKEAIPLPGRLDELTSGLGRYFHTNAHIFLRTLTLACVSFYFTYAGTQMGALTLAGNALLYQFFSVFSYFIDGFANAAEAVVGYSYGKRDRSMLKLSIRTLILWGATLASVVSVAYFFWGKSFLFLLTDQTDIRTVAMIYIKWIWLLPLAGFLSFLMDGIYIGLTATKEMFYTMLLAAVAFLILFRTLPFPDPNDALWCAFITYLVIRGIALSLLLPKYLAQRYYIGIGSTLRDKESYIRGLLRVEFGRRKLRLSSFYTTEEDGKGEMIYLNSVAELRDNSSPETLTLRLKELEKKAGRRPKEETKEVALDLDLVVCDDRILRPKDFGKDYFRTGYLELQQ